jgi:UTP--glucose-1-phosphate uridylyltransferase
LAAQERYLALEVQGFRYNIGVKYGLLLAQLALALDGADREDVLVQLVELLALRGRGRS